MEQEACLQGLEAGSAAVQGLQHSCCGQADAGAAGAAAAAAAGPASSVTNSRQQQQQQQQQQQWWRVASCSSDLPGASALLAVLPGSLTSLHLNLYRSGESEDFGQLARLTGVQQLHLEDGCSQGRLPRGCIAAIGQLSQLTSLRVTGAFAGFQQQLQQLLAQPLPLHQLCLDVVDYDERFQTAALLSLAHLTQLTELSCKGRSPRVTALPLQLQTLYHSLRDVRKRIDVEMLLPLQQLQHLTVCVEFAEQRRVLELPQLPSPAGAAPGLF
uniref:Uncharacterized protein n=1 Tax=Tetradesmus obliquus TaxID=3088 RepID=A0A383VAJ0_TETOB|eukprot:jgi/Sobl393_1/17175/SZX61772.1